MLSLTLLALAMLLRLLQIPLAITFPITITLALVLPLSVILLPPPFMLLNFQKMISFSKLLAILALEPQLLYQIFISLVKLLPQFLLIPLQLQLVPASNSKTSMEMAILIVLQIMEV